MTDRILGPAYPALLAPGLRVVSGCSGERGTLVRHGGVSVAICWDALGDDGGIALSTEGDDDPDLAIDYADPHTRDRVARALEVVLRGDVATTCPALDWLFSYPSRSTDRYRCAYDAWYAGSRPGAPARLSAAMRLRAVADAVWGSR